MTRPALSINLSKRIERLMPLLDEENTAMAARSFTIIADLLAHIEDLEQYINDNEPDRNEDV